MRALFIGGVVDNSEMDLEGTRPPLHYPENTGSGTPRYRLYGAGEVDGEVVYAIYGAPELPEEEVARIAEERGYARRFGAAAEPVTP
ncbi:hypothetical protein [Stenotrophomonas sp. MMGLT7]|uniref:hypothetical protein n=1 Tax=Stenotrophomonas sp. MMGLT7 TaxID=2901227 RepID=UPI001E5D967B|nr:hypothetical protein [Stenotrophomonas sp. MMGLT7]MCD7099276.1 hypothetical protein [Stenotrophomonas sp. MMGLT7]